MFKVVFLFLVWFPSREGLDKVMPSLTPDIFSLSCFVDSTREEALTKLVAILSQNFVAELLDSQKEDLMDLLKKCVKRGGTRECVLAANGKHRCCCYSGEMSN